MKKATFQDMRDEIATYMFTDMKGVTRLYNYRRFRQDEIERDLESLDYRLRLALSVAGWGRRTKDWLLQAKLRLASDILGREVHDWGEVESIEHIQIVTWACSSNNSSELWSWLRGNQEAIEATLAER